MDFFSLPIDAGPNDPPVGVDEFGNFIYRTHLGTTYIKPEVVQTQGPSLRERASILGDKIGNASWEGALQFSKALGQSLVDGVIQGIAAPGRAAMGEPVTFGDVMATVGMTNLGGAAMASPKGALRSASLRSSDEAVSPARKIATALRDGKASSLKTEDFNTLSAADEAELWDLYIRGETGMDLPMDQTSRFERAQKMGFDTSKLLYHGTKAGEIKDLRPGTSTNEFAVYSTRDPELAGEYAGVSRSGFGDGPAEGSSVIPLYSRGEHLDFTEAGSLLTRDEVPSIAQMFGLDEDDLLEAWDDLIDQGLGNGMDSMPTYSFLEWAPQFKFAIEDLGAKGIDFYDLTTKGAEFNRATLDPSDLRSPTARFDPRLGHISNLTAANASPILGLATTAMSPKEEIERYLENLR